MAIQDQFVTSFSELYLRVGGFTSQNGNVVGGSALPTEADVQDWFTDVTAEKVVTLTLTDNTAAAGTFAITLGDETFSATTTSSSTPTSVATALRTAINASDNFTTGSATAGVITITGVFAADYATTVTAGVSGIAGVFATSTEFSPLTRQVPLVMEIGTLSNEATVIDTPTFGEVFKGKLRGQLDGGQLDAQLYWAPRNQVHQLMRELAQDGREISVGIKWKPSATASDSETELVVFNSFVASFGIDTTFDDVAKASTTLVVDGAEHFAPGA